MAHILKNKNLELHFDTPFENYKFPRFDWTGKIVEVKFQGIQVSGVERTDGLNENYFGKGFYNEFGIDKALGFDETDIGGWFHKIGVGLLKKEQPEYLFSENYKIKPAKFQIVAESDRLLISCKSAVSNGYSYVLRKEIALNDTGFTIQYYLENTGIRDMVTNEYGHNFITINSALTGPGYTLKFPFQIKSELFDEAVNPEGKIAVGKNEIIFKGAPKEQFFFSNLSGSENVDAGWELINLERKIGIRETGSFQTNKVNLWGWTHVISPELFFNISIKPGETTEWSRTYEVYRIP
jgi:hypothetical protein